MARRALATVPVRSIDAIRARFPALSSENEWAFFENAGGSQVPHDTIRAVTSHMERHYVQLGAGYPASDAATATVDRAHAAAAVFASGRVRGAADGGRAVLGASSSALLSMLATALARTLQPGDEVIVASGSHESHVHVWERACASSGATLKVMDVGTKK